VRHGGAAKQRIWLGPGRYFCGCERRIAHADAYGDGDCNSNRRCYSDTNCNRRRNRDTNCNRDSNGDCNSLAVADSNGYINRETYSYSEACAIGTASAHTSTASLEIFAGNRLSAWHVVAVRSG
jgi:hypothetical protein